MIKKVYNTGIVSLLVIFVFTLFWILPPAASAYYNYMPASIVIGQPDFTSSAVNQGGNAAANTLRSNTQNLVVNGKLLIADAQNNRVLIYNSIPTTNNASADVVIGQTDMTGATENQSGIPGTTIAPTARTLDRPSGLATDGQRLFIMDRDNHRVLIYNSIPTTNNAEADVVIGHSTMDDNSWCGESALNNTTNLASTCLSSGPAGLAYDSSTGKLIVADNDNDRVLVFNQVPTINGAGADVVVGQPDFTHNATNQGGAVGANTLDLSTGSIVGTYGGKLLIADRINNRVLIYNSIPTTNNASADVVIGQVDFLHNSANKGGAVSASGFDNPRGAQVDASNGKLFVPDAGNARVLVFNQIPTTNNAAADLVTGQPDFVTITPGTTSRKLQTFPYHVEFFPGHFIVADGTNNRVLIFNNLALVDTNLSFSADTAIPLSSPAVNLIIKADSGASTLTINASNLQLSLPAGARFTVTSASRDLMVTNSGGATLTQSCNAERVATATLVASGDTGIITIAPTSDQCNVSSAGSPFYQPPVMSQGSHLSGSLVISNGTVYLIQNGQRVGFRDYSEYRSYGYNLNQVIAASNADLLLPQSSFVPKAMSGTLVIDTTDNRTVYMIGLNGSKRGFASASVFKALGYNFRDLLKINLSDYPAGDPISESSQMHPDGALVLAGQTVWWILGNARSGFESAAVFNSYGFSWDKIVPATPADTALSIGLLVKFRDGTLIRDGNSYYIISQGRKFSFSSSSDLTGHGYKISNAIAADLAAYEFGGPVQ